MLNLILLRHMISLHACFVVRCHQCELALLVCLFHGHISKYYFDVLENVKWDLRSLLLSCFSRMHS